MPVVTSGLLRYWNAKDGLQSTNLLRNIAPNGVAHTLVNTGGTMNAAGYLELIGSGDKLEMTDVAPLRRTTAWSVEYLFYLLNDPTGTYNELYGGAAYADITTPSYLYFEYLPGAGSAYEYASVTAATNVGAIGQHHLQATYDGTTLKIRTDGVERYSSAIGANQSFAGTAETWMRFHSAVYSTPFDIRWNAFRYYDRALTAAELTQNYQNGLEIGLSEPEVKIGVYRAKNAGAGFTDIPIYSITNHTGEKLRLMTSAGVGYIPIVATTDPLASRVRVRVGTTTMAMRK